MNMFAFILPTETKQKTFRKYNKQCLVTYQNDRRMLPSLYHIYLYLINSEIMLLGERLPNKQELPNIFKKKIPNAQHLFAVSSQTRYCWYIQNHKHIIYIIQKYDSNPTIYSLFLDGPILLPSRVSRRPILNLVPTGSWYCLVSLWYWFHQLSNWPTYLYVILTICMTS